MTAATNMAVRAVMFPMRLYWLSVILNTHGIILTKFILAARNPARTSHQNQKYPKYFDREKLHGQHHSLNLFFMPAVKNPSSSPMSLV
jgi:hypothetical protein